MTQQPPNNQDKPSSAVALEYDGENAPHVSAKGQGDLAEQIIAIAREHEIPLYENPELVRLLAQLDLGEKIPPSLYICIAQLIAFAYRVQGKAPPGWTEPEPSEKEL
ncbi:EscU/YscU/HrcU family type III secretion system export apparatus switch protein [Aestuariirhabdus sp. Z084]|uniref:EscU/YscU/HrcU family type III secretion system export apparatus switch protein n=1 Tax=Aestuariirhabdus haliotis TaxID=2918751 RepID=UPI00201B40AA|nr:EscU/YscU/HrcU family type III secretion system export apparatus switch protein [Aestuariirhabdus haliotis]MCL6415539.1 EscU/YscU/HrcU family type III secretion system export apparatus switch protein [Aestuariirhabdus haliotis]MCL6419256.1 EscU/YscU/HrcU family type III secretion system export apparatus switch protein [Aestuariirhabdus haliotis]